MGFIKKWINGEEASPNKEEYVYQSDIGDDPSSPKPRFILAKPVSRDELTDIARQLMEKKTVILNLSEIGDDTRRFVDFLTGVAFALNGQARKIAEHTFLIVPGGADVSGDIFNDIEDQLGLR